MFECVWLCLGVFGCVFGLFFGKILSSLTLSNTFQTLSVCLFGGSLRAGLRHAASKGALRQVESARRPVKRTPNTVEHNQTLRFSGWLDAFAPGGACPGHPVAVTLAGCFLNGLKTEPQSGKPLRGVPPLPGQPFPPSTLQNGRAVWRSAKGVQEGARAWSPEGLGTFSA